MANYQLVDIEQLEADLTTLADAIRSKTGTTGTLAFPTAMKVAVDGIPENIDMLGLLMTKTLTEVSHATVTNIPSSFFYSFSKLQKAEFPQVTTINNSAFYNCKSLSNIIFPNATTIGNCAFASCEIYNWSFPKVVTIGNSAFYTALHGSGPTTIDFSLCTTVGAWAFGNCGYISTVSLPQCTSIGSSAFKNCYKLETVSLPKCKNIGNAAFQWASALKNVHLPQCTSLGSTAFYGCSKLISINLPLVSTIINAFYACDAIETINLPVCTTISGSAFFECSSLKSLYLAASTVCALKHSSAFTRAGITTSTGAIYVPASLVDSYKTATNWTYFSTQIFATPEE